MFQGEVLLAHPCGDDGRIVDHGLSVNRILFHRHQLDSTSAFAQRFLLAAQAGIDQRKNTKSGSIIRVRLHDLLLLWTNRRKSRARLCFILSHPRKESAAKARAELNRIVAKCGVSECRQSQVCRCGIAFCQRAKEPYIGNTLNSFGIFRADLINCLVQGTSISFPIQYRESSRCLSLSIIWSNRQCEVLRRNLLGIATQVFVTECQLLQRQEVTRIQCHSALKIAHSFLVRTSPARDESGQFEDQWSVG